jgi:hypothetical protein
MGAQHGNRVEKKSEAALASGLTIGYFSPFQTLAIEVKHRG